VFPLIAKNNKKNFAENHLLQEFINKNKHQIIDKILILSFLFANNLCTFAVPKIWA